jgi:hypothetical protein
VRLCRLHYLMWDTEWARPFAQLAAAGIRLDSSYGPDWHCKGYLFGTAYPFHPLDPNGLPFTLWELPYEHSEMDEGASPEWLTHLADNSCAGDHAAIVSLFHPPFFSFAPSADTYRFWRAAPGLMARLGHPALNLEQVRRFMAAREETELGILRVPGAKSAVQYRAPDADASGLRLSLGTRGTAAELIPLKGAGQVAVP